MCISVSLEALDPVEMEKVRCGSLKKRDPRRAPITDYAEDLESLLSLTEEEEEGLGSQVFSFPEVRFLKKKKVMMIGGSKCQSLSSVLKNSYVLKGKEPFNNHSHHCFISGTRITTTQP